MAHVGDIRTGAEVLGSDGGMIGRVDHVHGQHIHILPTAPSSSAEHVIPFDWVERVDEHVHLNVTAAVARERWGADDDARGAGTYAAAAPVADRKTNWIPWVIGLVLLVGVLIFGLRSCGYVASDTDYEGNASDVNMAALDVGAMADANMAGAAAAAAPLGAAEAYLAGNEAGPRTFAFERLNFDTSSAAIRDADRTEITQLNTLLQRYPMVAVEIVGFTDARGGGAANAALGQQRADAVKAALVASGAAEARIRTRSGGESQPTATNATAGGQFENRRTEVVITR